MKMIKPLVIICIGLLPFTGLNAADLSAYNMPRTQVVPIKDDVINAEYELYVKLPESYDEKAGKAYPVIYFTDAVWHIDILSAAAEYLMEDVILVGISWQKDIDEALRQDKGEHVSRHRDYTIKPSKKAKVQQKYQLGKAKQHLRFIRDQVFKTVEKNYRVDSKNRTYFGYSTGSEFGALILLTQPELFNNYILGSPALKGDIAYLTELANSKRLKGTNLHANVYIAYGAEEEKNAPYIEQLINLLKARNDKSLALTHAVIDGNHKTAFPMIGLHSIKWLADLNTLTMSETVASSH